MIVLGIETSCDETAAAVVEDGCRILSDVVASQVDIHTRYGGIVPEVASRQHVLEIIPVLQAALSKAEIDLSDVDAIAVTQGPGLMGSLMVGVNTAKAIAYSRNLPLVGVHHIEGHTYAAWLETVDPSQYPGFPLIVLIASGAHTDLIVMHDHGWYEIVGRTRDDAAGEAFDKTSRILGLGYPGGPAVQEAAKGVVPAFRFPRAWLGESFDFSFSGLKTAVLHKAQEVGIYPPSGQESNRDQVAQLAAAFQESVVDVIATKAIRAVQVYKAKGLVLGGGVSANGPLRAACRLAPVPVLIPAPNLCTDNGSMIAAAGYYRYAKDGTHNMELDASPNLSMV